MYTLNVFNIFINIFNVNIKNRQMDKKGIRQHIRTVKSQFSNEERLRQSMSIWQKIEAMDRFRQAKVILLYWSLPDEVQTHDFILRWCAEKMMILPAVDGQILRLKTFTSEQQLKRNTILGLYEPQGEDYPTPQAIELAIIPGIAFDRQNHRLGRGKGYYDQLLPSLHAYKIGVGFDFQLLDNIPSDEHDIPMDEIVTE